MLSRYHSDVENHSIRYSYTTDHDLHIHLYMDFAKLVPDSGQISQKHQKPFGTKIVLNDCGESLIIEPA